jgi:hypothetical protein
MSSMNIVYMYIVALVVLSYLIYDTSKRVSKMLIPQSEINLNTGNLRASGSSSDVDPPDSFRKDRGDDDGNDDDEANDEIDAKQRERTLHMNGHGADDLVEDDIAYAGNPSYYYGYESYYDSVNNNTYYSYTTVEVPRRSLRSIDEVSGADAPPPALQEALADNNDQDNIINQELYFDDSHNYDDDVFEAYLNDRRANQVDFDEEGAMHNPRNIPRMYYNPCTTIPQPDCNPLQISCEDVVEDEVCGCDGVKYKNACEARYSACLPGWKYGYC